MNQPYKIPFWVKLFAFFSSVLFTTIVLLKINQKIKREETASLRAKVLVEQKAEQEAHRRKAEELAAEGFERLQQARRNQLYLLCRDDGNYPLLFIDKVVCVKPESIAWVKYDGEPQQDTSGGAPSN